ncbi:MAG: phosphotransferase family protein [Thermomicrobiales bacterium]
MTDDPAAFLHALGLATPRTRVATQPLAGGWGGNRLWRVDLHGYPPLVLRVLPGASDSGPRREAAIHAMARRSGIPAPEIVAAGTVPGRSEAAMAMHLMPGIPLSQALIRTPDADTARSLGDAAGRMLARVHTIPASSLLTAGAWPGESGDSGSWLTWKPVSPTVRHIAEDADTPTTDWSLLHLDFHLENLLADPATGAITAVLDWTNARLGPPEADLARTQTVLETARLLPDLPPGANTILNAFTEGFMDGHAAVHGPADPVRLRAATAWALDAQIADLTPKLGTPGVSLTASTLAHLRTARDEAIAAAERIPPQR